MSEEIQPVVEAEVANKDAGEIEAAIVQAVSDVVSPLVEDGPQVSDVPVIIKNLVAHVGTYFDAIKGGSNGISELLHMGAPDLLDLVGNACKQEAKILREKKAQVSA